ncbi:MAG: 5'/3'-nucleotidase SurE [candidate division Zixibacteria bacterium]|nr:5'/3'-nucleotidase SurE [candidate division Zixibacteria bacterium]
MPKKKPLILLSNDDGYHADGLRAAIPHLLKLGRLFICAPDRERSGTSHSLTLERPLRINKIEKDFYTVDGTPTDSVMVAVHGLLKDNKPDLLISGINKGPNLCDDITYSGTVAAAMEGTLLGIPSIAVSLVVKNRHKPHWEVAAEFMVRVAKYVLKNGLPEDTLLNVNVPNTRKASPDRYSVTTQGRRIYEDVITEHIDPRGKPYYWIGGVEGQLRGGKKTDLAAIKRGVISVTPLHLDLTNYGVMRDLSLINL